MLQSRALLMLLWLAVAACASIPFLAALHTYPISSFYAEFAAGICWVALAVAVLALTWRNRMGLPRIALAPLALIIVLFVQLRAAPPLNSFLSLVAVIFLLAAAVVCGLGARCRNLPGVLEALAIGLILGGLLTVAIELLQAFRVAGLPQMIFSAMDSPETDRRMWGNLNQPNHVASYLAFGVAACAFLAYRWRRARIPLAVITLLLLVGISLTFSRMTWVHLAVVGGLIGLAWTVEQHGRQRWARAAMPMVALLVAYQLCNWLVAYANIRWHLDLPTSLGERMQEGVGSRAIIWTHAWHMFLAHPWFGGGWGDYAWNQYLQTDELGRAALAVNAHNIVLDQLAKVGVLGLLAIALPFLGFAWSLRKRRITPELAFLLAVILVMGGHSMLEFPLHYLYFLLPLAFALGYADERILPKPSSGMTWASTAVITVGAIALMPRLWGDYSAVERLYYAPEGLQKEWARYQKHGPNLWKPYEQLAIAVNVRVVPEAAASLAELEFQAAQLYPGWPTVQRYALALAYLGKTDKAVLQMRRLFDEYWIQPDYAPQIWLVKEHCDRKVDALNTFCARLKSEKLLVEGAAAEPKPASASQ